MNERASKTIIQAVYFGQTEFYYSEFKEKAWPIDHMAPQYAANAAQKLLRDAAYWAQEAGVTTDHPMLWMTTTKLFNALVWRAGI